MGFLMMDVDEIRELREREKKLTEYLKKIEKWEADVIMTDDCWKTTFPMLTKELCDKWLELQKERNKLLKR